MQITLKCRHSHGSASFPAELIEGHHAPDRRYEIKEHEVVLKGHMDVILHHDADALLAMPGELYRLPTLEEQEQATSAKRKASTAQESQEKSG